MPKPQEIRVNEEDRMIPAWSMILAGLSFVAVEYYFWVIAPTQHHHPPPPIYLRTYFNLSWGVVAALYSLMVGYISNDARRRAMSVTFWIIICLVMPAGIGLVIYFLLRQPQFSLCPGCGTHVQGDFHFCPQCNYQLVANCGNCFRAVRATDRYCTRCGHDLAQDHMPARLHVMSE